MSKIDQHWHSLFLKYDIVSEVKNNGYFDITATQIKEFHEARLMCKMDFREQVAKPFKDNMLSILAIENGLYRIAKTDTFFEINLEQIQNTPPREFQLPNFIETLNLHNIKGESQALDAAMASGMINCILGEENFLTVRGRRRSASFEIGITEQNGNNICKYPISGVQIEVDGGYESENCLALIEAKMKIGVTNNMNLRQLLYPHIHFQNTIDKDVKTYLMFYETGGLYTFIPMLLINEVASLEYNKIIRYKLVENDKKTTSPLVLEKLPAPDTSVPFPQADDFDKVMYALLKLHELQPISKEELFSELPIPLVSRQYSYYSSTLMWFNLAEQEGRSGPLKLTELGELFASLSEKDFVKGFTGIFYQDELVNFMVKNPDTDPPYKLMNVYGINLTTAKRRRVTILQWHKYFQENI